jgi:uncharacterized surface protein with fasciclin (FAS1) repeats
MFAKQSWMRVALLALMAISLVGLPMAAGAADMANGITSPAEGATVKGSATVTGYASDPNFAKWQLDVLPGGAADAAIFLAFGEEAGEFSVDVDTTNFPDGEHALRLRVVRSDSNYDEYVTKFTVANAAAPAATTPSASAGKDIVSTAVAAGTFKTLAAALTATGLDKTLMGAGPFTVFAPTDEAFAKLPAGTVESLLKDTKALSNILLYHVVAGKVMSSDLTNGMKANTVQGSPVTFTVADGKVKVNDANVTAADIETSNGVIHVIDSVLLPPAGSAAAPTAPTAPANGITSPTDGATVKGTATITGNANDANFAKWQLDVLPGGAADAAIFLAVGEEAGEFSYEIDTTQFPNGEHALRLRVVRSDSNYDEYITKFTIAN